MSSLFLLTNLVNLSVLTEAESSNDFVDPMLERPPKVLPW